MTKLVGKLPHQTPRNADLGTMAYQDKDSVSIESAKINNFEGFFNTEEYVITDIGNTPVTAFTANNHRGVYLITVNGVDSSLNLYSTSLYVLTVGAYDKELSAIGNPSNHYGNGTLTLSLSSGSALNVDILIQSSRAGSSANATVRTIRLA